MHVKLKPTDFKTSPLVELLKAQSQEGFCQQSAEVVSLSGTGFSLNKDNVSMRRAPIDGEVQKLVPKAMRQRILYLSSYLSLAGHPDQGRIYETMRRD